MASFLYTNATSDRLPEYGYFLARKFLELAPVALASLRRRTSVSVKEKLRVMVEHTKLFEELLGGIKNFAVMKKHFKAYVNGFDGAAELRGKLMEANNAEEVKSIVDNFLASKKASI